MPEKLRGFPLSGLLNAKRLDDGDCEGVACYRVQGEYHTGSRAIVWIERARSLIRRIDEESELKSCTTVCTTTYSPELNVAVSSERLEFEYEAPELWESLT